MSATIINFDPEAVTRQGISRILKKDGFDVKEAASVGQCGSLAASGAALALIPLLSGDPATNGLCAQLRQKAIAIILRVPKQLTVEMTELLKECEADHYVPADASPMLLLAAVGATLRHAQSAASAARVREDLHVISQRTAHDLAEPIRTLTTFVEMVQQGGAERFTADENAYFEFVESAIARTRRLLQYLSAYSHIGREGSSGFGDVPLDVAVTSALHTLRPQMLEAGTVVDVREPLPVVRGNLQRLQDLFARLVANAIKYRRPGTAGCVRISAEREASRWIVSVADDGIGIAAQYHERIFRPFERLHGRSVPGNGLGLALCQKIVEAHGGRIWVESVPEQGATFRFTLPGARADG